MVLFGREFPSLKEITWKDFRNIVDNMTLDMLDVFVVLSKNEFSDKQRQYILSRLKVLAKEKIQLIKRQADDIGNNI